jgi:hypothetical protein
VFFESELTNDPVYVRAQTVLIRRLFYSSDAQIYSDLPGLPEIADAVVVPLGQATSTTALRDGQRYGVIEQRFAIIPEQSGTLLIPAISVTSSVRLDAGGRSRRSGVRIGTEPIPLEVLPIPPEYPAAHPWLPAENVFVSDEWMPPGASLQVGDPVDRVVHVRVAGNLSSIIPPVADSLPDQHFRQYPEPPTLEDDSGGLSVVGRRTQTYSLIATAPGSVTLPAVEVVWWDVAARAVRTSRVPPRRLQIDGTAPLQTAEPEPVAELLPTEDPDMQAALERDVRSEQLPWPGQDRRRGLWAALLAAIAVGAIWWAMIWQRARARATATHTGALARAEPSRRERWLELKAACRRDDPAAVHRALLAYLRVHFGTSLPEALRQFRALGNGPLLDRMNAGLYQPASQTGARGDEVLRAVRQLRRGHYRRSRDPLPALYD